jgi:hypothetical protein
MPAHGGTEDEIVESLYDAFRAAAQGRISWDHAAAALDVARLWFQLREEDQAGALKRRPTP